MKREKKLSGMKSQSVNDRPLMDYAIEQGFDNVSVLDLKVAE